MTTLQALAERMAHGGVLGDEEAPLVFASHDLLAIGMMADDVRRQLRGTETTFLRVFEIHVDAVPAALPPGVSAGEFRLVGRPSSIDLACAAVERARRLAGEIPLTGFSLADLAHLESSAADTFSRLATAGLDAVADIPVDLLARPAVASARAAGLRCQRLTVHAATPDPLELLHAARQLQSALGGFRTFAPLPRTVSVTTPTTGYDDVKVVALARLLIRDIPSIQVDWPLYGPKLAQVALTVGADDVDGIAAVESAALGARRSALEEIRGNIRAAGLHAVERDGRFQARGR